MPDLMWKHFGYGQLWPLWPAAARIGLDSICSKEGMDHTVSNQPRSDLDGLVRVWSNTSGPEATWCAGIIWQEETGQLPVSNFQTRFRSSIDVPHNIVQNQPRSDLVLADCARFGPNGSGLETSQCA